MFTSMCSRLALIVVVGLALVVSGCLWIRILNTKAQLCDEPQRITVQYQEGRPTEITFDIPTLKSTDIEFLAGASPSQIVKQVSEEKEALRYTYHAVPRFHRASSEHVIRLDLLFADPENHEHYQLSKVRFPDQFRQFLRKPLVDKTIALACTIQLDNLRSNRVEVTLDHFDHTEFPTKEHILTLFGPSIDTPTFQNGLTYEYCLTSCDAIVNEARRIARVNLAFHDSGYLHHLQARYFQYEVEADLHSKKGAITYNGDLSNLLAFLRW